MSDVVTLLVPTTTVTTTNSSTLVNTTPTSTLVTLSGQTGAQGAPGNIFYTYTQSSPSALWVIHHALNGYPVAVVMDTAGTVCEGTISYTDSNTCTISFSAAFSGTAYII